MHRFVYWWRIGHPTRHERCFSFVRQWIPRSKFHLTTSSLRSLLWDLWYPWNDLKRLHLLCKCCQCRYGCYIVHLPLEDCRNPQFGRPIHLISFTMIVGCVPAAWLCEFVKLHLLLPKSFHVLLYCVRDFPHHPAWFVIFARLAQRCILTIFLVFSVLSVVGSCIIALNLSDSIEHLPICCLRLSGFQSCVFSMSHIFLLLHNCCLCVFN